MISDTIVNLDFETRSACDLTTEGGYRYYSDPTTEVICAAYSINDGNIQLWVPGEPYPFPRDCTIQAWNAGFERGIWQFVCENVYDWPKKRIPDFICTAALARSNSLPGSLENAGTALRVKVQKSRRGQELIKLLCIPIDYDKDGNPIYNEDDDLHEEMYDYCIQDVATEATIARCLRPWTEQELAEYWANERVNDAGLPVDIAFARKAVTYSQLEMDVLQQRLSEATDGQITSPKQYQRVKHWLFQGREEIADKDGQTDWVITETNPRISNEVLKYMRVWKQGERKFSLDKSVRFNILAQQAEDPEFISEEVQDVIELVDLAGRSSTAKYRRMVEREVDGKIYGAFMFAGASGTGRFSSTGVQVHNLVRDCVDDFDAALKQLDAMEDKQVIHTLAKMMRPTIKAEPGYKLYWSDWSNVEGRALPWLADTRTAAYKLDLFAEIDRDPDPNRKDIYEIMAERMQLPDRQTGKVAELSLGFGGSVGALTAMARGYGVKVTEPLKVVHAWREQNSWAQSFWYQLKNAAWDAMTKPGTWFHAGRVRYAYTPDTHNGLGTLWCKLPSGRLLAYPFPRFEHVQKPWSDDPADTMLELTALKANWKPAQGETDWPRHKLWYGVLAENITQATCADLLRNVLVELQREHIMVIGHTHDEVIASSVSDIGHKLKAIMQDPPLWAAGLPLVADINSGQRYSK